MKAVRATIIQRVGPSTSESRVRPIRLAKFAIRRYPKNQCQIFRPDPQVAFFPPSYCRTRSIQSHNQSYTTSVMNRIPSHTRSPPTSQKKPPSSFKAGPYRGAILSPGPPVNTAPLTPVSHLYSPSKLRQLLKPPRSAPSRAALHFPHSDTIKQHLEELLFPLQFSDQLACRIVSSKNLVKSQASLDELRAQRGDVGYAALGEHNTKLSFMGRRLMHYALSDFLSQAPLATSLAPDSCRLSVQVLEDALLTKFVLGQYVGNQWELEKIMRWRELDGLAPGSGELGTRLSLAVFNSLVLPHLSFRLDPAFLPAIKAVQLANRELERPDSGLTRWKELDLTPFLTHERPLEKQNHPLPPPSV